MAFFPFFISISSGFAMKKLLQPGLVAVLLLAGTSAAHAQLSAGHILLSGSIGYSQEKDGVGDDQDIYASGDISPTVGYFVADNLAIGLSASYNASSHEHKSKSNGTEFSSKTTTTSVAVGPMIRYYSPVGERAAFFGQLDAGFGSSKEKTEVTPSGGKTNDFDAKYSLLGIGITPGFTFFPTDHFGLEISIGALSYVKAKPSNKPDGAGDTYDDDHTNTSLEARFGLQNVQLGAAWYLGGK